MIIYFIYFLPLIGCIGSLVAGIMVLAGKEKSVKILGLGFIIEALSSSLSSFTPLVSRMVNVKTFAAFSVTGNYVSLFGSTAALLCMCIFLHKNYGKKLIYIPLLAIHVGGWFISRFVVFLLMRTAIKSNAGTWISLTNLINNFVVIAAVNVIIIIVLLKNRNIEKVIPQAWLCKTISLGGTFFGLLFNSLSYLAVLMNMKLFRQNELSIYLIYTAFNLVCLILPVYTTVMVYKKKKEPEQV